MLVFFWVFIILILCVGVGFSSDDSPKYEFNVSFKFNELPIERIIEIQKMLSGLAEESCDFTFKVTKKFDNPFVTFSNNADTDGTVVYQNGIGYYMAH